MRLRKAFLVATLLLTGCQPAERPTLTSGKDARAEARRRWDARLQANPPVIVSEGVHLLPPYAGTLPYAVAAEGRANGGRSPRQLALNRLPQSDSAL